MTAKEYVDGLKENYPDCIASIVAHAYCTDRETIELTKDLAEKAGIDEVIDAFKEHVAAEIADPKDLTEPLVNLYRRALPEIDRPSFRRYLMGRLGMM